MVRISCSGQCVPFWYLDLTAQACVNAEESAEPKGEVLIAVSR